MITLNSLSKIYRTDEIETVALENVNLTVERGEFLSIMGPSGCGKSTLLNKAEFRSKRQRKVLEKRIAFVIDIAGAQPRSICICGIRNHGMAALM